MLLASGRDVAIRFWDCELPSVVFTFESLLASLVCTGFKVGKEARQYIVCFSERLKRTDFLKI